MSKLNNVSFSFKCNENWDAMKPCQDGRHCKVCNKTVIDFSNKTHEEFIQILHDNQAGVCGKFNMKSTVYQQNKIKSIPAKWLAGLMLFLGIQSCNDTSMYENTNQEKNATNNNYHQLLGRPLAPFKSDSTKKRKKNKCQ